MWAIDYQFTEPGEFGILYLALWYFYKNMTFLKI